MEKEDDENEYKISVCEVKEDRSAGCNGFWCEDLVENENQKNGVAWKNGWVSERSPSVGFMVVIFVICDCTEA